MTTKSPVSIEGKTVAITGPARGIGHATATGAVGARCAVVIGDRDVAALRDVVRRLPGRVTGHLDVSDPESFANFLDRARRRRRPDRRADQQCRG